MGATYDYMLQSDMIPSLCPSLVHLSIACVESLHVLCICHTRSRTTLCIHVPVTSLRIFWLTPVVSLHCSSCHPSTMCPSECIHLSIHPSPSLLVCAVVCPSLCLPVWSERFSLAQAQCLSHLSSARHSCAPARASAGRHRADVALAGVRFAVRERAEGPASFRKRLWCCHQVLGTGPGPDPSPRGGGRVWRAAAPHVAARARTGTLRWSASAGKCRPRCKLVTRPPQNPWTGSHAEV